MKNRLAVVCAGILVVLLLSLLVVFNHQKPRLLILHSFSEDGAWEKAFDAGFRKELARNLEPNSVRWHYMLFSQHLSTRRWMAASRRSREMIDGWNPDVVVTVGEEAQEFVGRHYAGSPAPRLVYAMGEEPAEFGYPSARNVTGVLESLPLDQVLEITRFLGRPVRIRALGINDPTGRAEARQVRDFDWGPDRLLGVDLVNDYVDWQTAVQAAGQDADVLLVLSTGGLPKAPGSAEDVETAVLADWTERTSKPLVIGSRESFVAGGGALAVVPSARGLGEQAAHQALLALQSVRSGQPLPAPEANRDYLIALRPDLLAARSLALPDIYFQSARASNSLYPLHGHAMTSHHP